MRIIYCFVFSLLLQFQFLFFYSKSSAKSVPALAILSKIRGEIIAGPKNKLVNGFNGKMLWKRYYIKTRKNSSTTIFFKDGSEIRLFEQSNLIIGLKKSATKRWVRYRILLKEGSFWGYFARGKSPVEVSGKDFRLLASNASIRFSKQGNSHNISANSGIVKVFNNVSSVKLISGQRLYNVQKNDFLPQKTSPFPNQLKLSVEPKNLIFSSKESLMINLFIQVVRSGTETKINRPGPIYLRSNYYNLIIPNSIRLDTEGNAKISLEVLPPHSNDRTFEGSIIFQTLMDHKSFDDVKDGSLKVKFGLTSNN